MKTRSLDTTPTHKRMSPAAQTRVSLFARRADMVGIVAVCLIATRCLAVPLRATEPDRAGIEFFETKIRPVLAEHCYGCHSTKAAAEKKLKGGLLVDSRDGLLKGGDSGAAVVVAKPNESLLLQALRHESLEMPPKGKLPDTVIADFAKWIEIGVPDPRRSSAVPASGGIDIEKGRQHWAFRPPNLPTVPKVSGADEPIDAFVHAALKEKGLTPSPAADRRTLVRRVYFDLLGLPPTPEQVDAFVADSSPDAVAKLVDTLLDSPHYGERWGRHWLDVARYGEDQAINGIQIKEAFRYRDWVIAAFNNDMPYDQFIRLQIAGDMLPESNGDLLTRLAGTGLFVNGLSLDNGANKNPLKEADELDDRIDTMTRGFLGLTVSCSRCHDHKYDPIPTVDYYSLAGVFRGVGSQEQPLASEAEVKAYHEADSLWRKEFHVMHRWITAKAQQISEQQVPQIPQYMAATRKLRDAGVLSGKDTDQPAIETAAKDAKLDPYYLRQWLKALEPRHVKNVPAGIKAWLAASPQDALRLAEAFRDEVAEAVAAVKAMPDEGKVDRNTEAGKRRLEQGQLLRSLWNDQNTPLFTKQEIAEKLLSPADTAKLAALNKKWKDLQAAVPPRYDLIRVLSGNGRGMNVLIRGNPASQGPAARLRFLQVLSSPEPPEKFTRLELADAAASSENPLTARVIVNRVWAWHFGRGLVATPSNFGAMGGRPSHPELLDWLAVRFVEEGWSLKWLHREIMRSQTWQQMSIDVAANAVKDADNTYLWRFNRRRLEIEPWRDSLLAVAGRLDLKPGGPSLDLRDANNVRRTVYGKVSRKDLDPLLAMFDFPDANVTAEKRNVTTVPQQQLVVLNSEFFVTQVQAFAARAAALAKTDSERVVAAYRLAFGREPVGNEATLAAEFLALPPVPEDKLSRWEQYCQLLLASNEFCFVD